MVTSLVNYVLIPLAVFCAGMLAVFFAFTVIRYCIIVVRECREEKLRASSCAYKHLFECHICPHYRECKIRSHERKDD